MARRELEPRKEGGELERHALLARAVRGLGASAVPCATAMLQFLVTHWKKMQMSMV